jgi:hypothetical protein
VADLNGKNKILPSDATLSGDSASGSSVTIGPYRLLHKLGEGAWAKCGLQNRPRQSIARLL